MDNAAKKVGVAPREGAWIEIDLVHMVGIASEVAPREGAWIEIHAVGSRLLHGMCRAP